jgi:hypothetical protein
MIQNGDAQMPSEKIIDVLWGACGCDAPLACIFAKTGENYSPRTQVFFLQGLVLVLVACCRAFLRPVFSVPKDSFTAGN